jgi:hypothetical protein
MEGFCQKAIVDKGVQSLWKLYAARLHPSSTSLIRSPWTLTELAAVTTQSHLSQRYVRSWLSTPF